MIDGGFFTRREGEVMEGLFCILKKIFVIYQRTIRSNQPYL
jgi:hypothetical protein